MRYTDIILFEADSLEEAMLYEAFMSNLVKLAGDKFKSQVTNVTNAATAAQVLYKVMSRPEYTEVATFLLKKAIKLKLKNMEDGPFKQAVSDKFPPGRTGKDFLKGLIIICVINAVSIVKDAAKAQALDAVTNSILNVDNLVTQILGASTGGVGTVFQTLGVANTILFQVLTDISVKINATPVGN